MRRTETIFAIATVLLVALGLLTRRLPGFGLSIYGGHRSYGLRSETAFFGVAALFALFASLYSLGYIPFVRTLSQWHPWLSIAGVLLFVAGMWSLAAVASRQPPISQGLPVVLVAIGVLGGQATFVLAQIWFAVGFLVALRQMANN